MTSLDDARGDGRQPAPAPPVIAGSTSAQLKALAHPLRQRLLFTLGRQPATISQLAASLDARKGNIAHHLKVLRAAGLVAVTETRQVRGGTEQYYQRTGTIDIAGKEAAPATAMLAAVAQEFAAAPGDPLLALRHVRLTAAGAERLHALLRALITDTEDAGDGEPRYGLLVSFYQQPTVEPPDGPA